MYEQESFQSFYPDEMTTSFAGHGLHFLIVENDPDDAYLIARAFKKIPHCGTVSLTRNTSEAKAYLKGAGMYADRQQFPFPSAILSEGLGLKSAGLTWGS